MFNNKRIKELEKSVYESVKNMNRILTALSITENPLGGWFYSKEIKDLEKKLKALESYLNIEYKVTPAKEGYHINSFADKEMSLMDLARAIPTSRLEPKKGCIQCLTENGFEMIKLDDYPPKKGRKKK